MIFTRNCLFLCLFFVFKAEAQRSYKANSVLASGTWYKISVDAPGVYKMDLAFLNSLGIQGSIPSNSLRLFGNGGGMLSENNSTRPFDDLEENAILVVDGGDGQVNAGDYVLFFAEGPHKWLKDSAGKKFIHQKNLFSDNSYYYISVGGSGKRILQQTAQPAATQTVTSFSERYFYELDSVNFLSSGKEWFGEEFSNAPGKVLSHNFTLSLPDLVSGQPDRLGRAGPGLRRRRPRRRLFRGRGEAVGHRRRRADGARGWRQGLWVPKAALVLV